MTIAHESDRAHGAPTPDRAEGQPVSAPVIRPRPFAPAPVFETEGAPTVDSAAIDVSSRDSRVWRPSGAPAAAGDDITSIFVASHDPLLAPTQSATSAREFAMEEGAADVTAEHLADRAGPRVEAEFDVAEVAREARALAQDDAAVEQASQRKASGWRARRATAKAKKLEQRRLADEERATELAAARAAAEEAERARLRTVADTQGVMQAARAAAAESAASGAKVARGDSRRDRKARRAEARDLARQRADEQRRADEESRRAKLNEERQRGKAARKRREAAEDAVRKQGRDRSSQVAAQAQTPRPAMQTQWLPVMGGGNAFGHAATLPVRKPQERVTSSTPAPQEDTVTPTPPGTNAPAHDSRPAPAAPRPQTRKQEASVPQSPASPDLRALNGTLLDAEVAQARRAFSDAVERAEAARRAREAELGSRGLSLADGERRKLARRGIIVGFALLALGAALGVALGAWQHEALRSAYESVVPTAAGGVGAEADVAEPVPAVVMSDGLVASIARATAVGDEECGVALSLAVIAGNAEPATLESFVFEVNGQPAALLPASPACAGETVVPARADGTYLVFVDADADSVESAALVAEGQRAQWRPIADPEASAVPVPPVDETA